MGFSWFRVDTAAFDHPKVLELCARLNEPLAFAYVARLWGWTQRYAPDGAFSARAAAQLVSVLQPKPGHEHVLDVMVEVGLVDAVTVLENEKGEKNVRQYEVHDWDEMQGKMASKAKKDAEVKRQKRAAAKVVKELAADSGARRNGAKTAPKRRAPQVDSGARPALLRDETRRDETRRDEQELFSRDAGKTPHVTAPVVPEPPPDPRHAPLVAELVRVYRDEMHAPYAFTGRDAKHVQQLLSMARSTDEVAFRWAEALRSTSFPKVRTLSELVTHWNHFPAIPAEEAAELGLGGAGRNGSRL